MLYGLSDEWHQLHVPGRDGSLADVLADGAGAVLGATLLAAISARKGNAGETR
jgi:VanZ family protein